MNGFVCHAPTLMINGYSAQKSILGRLGRSGDQWLMPTNQEDEIELPCCVRFRRWRSPIGCGSACDGRSLYQKSEDFGGSEGEIDSNNLISAVRYGAGDLSWYFTPGYGGH